jgi:glutamate synthase (NADPH) large chain
LGPTGRNFAAGMSGGLAYVLDEDDSFHIRCNQEMVYLERIEEAAEADEIRDMIEDHWQYTESPVARRVLDAWNELRPKFVKVFPMDYKQVLEEQALAAATGKEPELHQELVRM